MRLNGLFIGKIARYSCGKTSFLSAMKGREVESLEITHQGIVGNEIADTIHHEGQTRLFSLTMWNRMRSGASV